MARSAVTKGALGKVGVEIGIEGIDQIKKAIAAKMDRMTGLQAKKVFMRAALILVREARDNVNSITGQLSAAIFAAYGKQDKANVLVGVSIGGRGKAPYGWVVEHGHVIWKGGRKRSGTGKQVGTVKPHPYMAPAIKSARPAMAATIAEGLKELAEKT